MANCTKLLSLFHASIDRKQSLWGLPLHKKYRGQFELIALVLEAVKDGGATRFSIMKQASLNCSQAKKYLQPLMGLSMIEVNFKEGRCVYGISDKGLAFLAQYHVLLGMLIGAPKGGKSADFEYGTEYATGMQRGSESKLMAHLQRNP